MWKHYIILFVLVMSMVKTNAQLSYYYYKGKKVELHENDNAVLLKLANYQDEVTKNVLLQKIKQDKNVQLGTSSFKGYILLTLNSQSSKNTVLDYYRQQPEVISALPAYENASGSFLGVSNEIYLKLKRNVGVEVLQQVLQDVGYVSLEENAYGKGRYLIKLSKQSALHTLDIANSLYETGYFDAAEPNFFLRLNLNSCTTPSPWTINDPYFSNQWNLYNCGSGPYGGSAGADINIFSAWLQSGFNAASSPSAAPSGLNTIKVAVIDLGVDLNHEDLVVGSGYDATGYGGGSGGDAYPTPQPYEAVNAHGTICAGIIGAKLNNTVSPLTYIGVTGVAPGVTIKPVRIGYQDYVGYPFFAVTTITDVYTIADGIDWAVYNGAVDVINMSLSLGSASTVIDNAIDDAVNDGRGGLGCAIACSAGNEGTSNIDYPSGNENTIAVGASNMCDGRVTYDYHPYGVTDCDYPLWRSNYGTAYSGMGTNILSVIAPGIDISSTDYTGAYGYTSGNYYTSFSGTSASAPEVAGVAALMYYVNPCLRWDEVKSIIEITAKKVTGTVTHPYAYSTGYPSGTWNSEVGYGRLDAGNAITLAHDVYKQNRTEISTIIYSSNHITRAGYNVTSVIPPGYYDVQSGSNISFYAPEHISLEPGFIAEGGSVFLAKIDTRCKASDAHYKRTNPINRHGITNNSSTENVEIYPNPAHDKLNIDLTIMQDEPVAFIISNMLGQQQGSVVLENMKAGKRTRTLPIESLIPGIYLITVKTDNGLSQFKFVKE